DRCEAEAALAADLLREAPAREVLPRRRALGAAPEHALVVRGRLLEQRLEAVTVLPFRLDGPACLLVLERDPEAVCQPPERAGEVEVLGLAHERDEVAALVAAEAVEELVDGVHGHARRPLLVKDAAPEVPRARLLQLRPGADDVEHVGRNLDGFDRLVL